MNKTIINYLNHLKYIIISILLISISFAYVGPGAGISFLGALWAVIVAIFLAVGGFLAWPIRAMMRKRKLKKEKQKNG